MNIRFTKAHTMATCLCGPLGARQFHLKAVAPKSAQRVGMAEITEDGIVVKTCSGRPVGVVKTREEAKRLIHQFHRSDPMYIGHEKDLASKTK